MEFIESYFAAHQRASFRTHCTIRGDYILISSVAFDVFGRIIMLLVTWFIISMRNFANATPETR